MARFVEDHEELLQSFLQTKVHEHAFAAEIQTGLFGNSLAVAMRKVLVCGLRTASRTSVHLFYNATGSWPEWQVAHSAEKSLLPLWGKADINEIGIRMPSNCCIACHRLDGMRSKGTKGNHRQRRRLRRAAARLRQRIRNLVDDLHKKLVSWLVKNFSLILLPEFRSQQMVRRGHRRIGSRTARAMLTWSHYRFRQRLLNKAKQFPSCYKQRCRHQSSRNSMSKRGKKNTKKNVDSAKPCWTARR